MMHGQKNIRLFWKTFSRGHSSRRYAFITSCCLSISLFTCFL